MEGGVFGPLKDQWQFKRFRVDPETETIVWENGADLAPAIQRMQRTLVAASKLAAPYTADRRQRYAQPKQKGESR